MSLSATSPVEGSSAAVQHHSGRTALWQAAAAAAWVSVPAWQLQGLGFPLSVTAGQVLSTHPRGSPVPVRSACALAVARSGSESMEGDTGTKIPRLTAYIQPVRVSASLCRFPLQGRSGMRRDWLVSPCMPHREEGGANGAHIREASCQLRIAFLLIYTSADIMTNEQHTAYFNRSKKEVFQS